MKLSVVIACFNEEQGLLELYNRISSTCRLVAGEDYEIVFVNDGSNDGTWGVLDRLVSIDRHLVCIDLSRNFGQQPALMAGLSHSRGSRVLVLDADLQDPPELLSDMWRVMDEGYDVVFGQRRTRESDGWFKRCTAFLFYRLLNSLSSVPVPSDVGDFRLMSRPVVDAVLEMPEAFPFLRGMVAWAGYRQIALSYDRAFRYRGSTGYTIPRMLALALDGLTGFSVAPLRAISLIAVLTMMASFLLLAFSIYAWIALPVVPGWTSLFALILFMSSLQLLALGVIGEYVGRTFMEAKRRPTALLRCIKRGRPQ